MEGTRSSASKSVAHTVELAARNVPMGDDWFRYEILIGSENKTHRLDSRYLQAVMKWARNTFLRKGCFISYGNGMDNGVLEDSIVVMVLAKSPLDPDLLKQSITELKRVLGQRSILVTASHVKVMKV